MFVCVCVCVCVEACVYVCVIQVYMYLFNHILLALSVIQFDILLSRMILLHAWFSSFTNLANGFDFTDNKHKTVNDI